MAGTTPRGWRWSRYHNQKSLVRETIRACCTAEDSFILLYASNIVFVPRFTWPPRTYVSIIIIYECVNKQSSNCRGRKTQRVHRPESKRCQFTHIYASIIVVIIISSSSSSIMIVDIMSRVQRDFRRLLQLFRVCSSYLSEIDRFNNIIGLYAYVITKTKISIGSAIGLVPYLKF